MNFFAGFFEKFPFLFGGTFIEGRTRPGSVEI